MAQQDWARWVFASIADTLKEVADDCRLPVLVEHLDERTEAFMASRDKAEIRITGPYDTELSKGFHRLYVDVNVLLSSQFGNQKNAYDTLKAAGAFQSAMSRSIPVYNYGSEEGDYVEGDDETLFQLGCLTPRVGRPVSVFNFGQVSPSEKFKQTEVSASYVIELQE